MKLSKDTVDYSKGMAKSHCSICTYWVDGGKCRRVAGEIRPDFWCKLFKKAE